MHAVDTNVVVRFLTNDDDEQFRRARGLIASENVFVTKTVVLECEWVLRSVYRYDVAAILEALGSFADLPSVAIEDAAGVRLALNWAAAGMDFADALHLAGAHGCTAFVSFDRALGRIASRLATLPVVEP